MVVVDSFRFPYFESGGVGTTDPMGNDMVTQGPSDVIYSLQRLQPHRGGQAIPVLPATAPPLQDFHYGFSEQTAPLQIPAGPFVPPTGRYGLQPITGIITSTIGRSNDPRDEFPAIPDPMMPGMNLSNALAQNDSIPFHDRDFQSVAELLLVPGCPPGLFTKRFVENAPDNDNNLDTVPAQWYDSQLYTTPPTRPAATLTNSTPSAGPPYVPGRRTSSVGQPFDQGTHPALPPFPRTYPYLVDHFYYNGVPGANDDGWHQLLEFFEVPPPNVGAIGEVAYGNNGDWFRQDGRPGQLNLNLIIDEEVFLGLIDDPRLNLVGNTISSQAPSVVTQIDSTGTPTAFYNMADRGTVVIPMDPVRRMTAAFADFLKLRHSGGQTNAMYFGDSLFRERPFRSLTFPDVNYTILRPAATVDLPAGTTTSTDATDVIAAIPAGTRDNNANMRSWYQDGAMMWQKRTDLVLPQIPPRRLFQPPDFNDGSNASEIPLMMAQVHPTLFNPTASLVRNATAGPDARIGGQSPSGPYGRYTGDERPATPRRPPTAPAVPHRMAVEADEPDDRANPSVCRLGDGRLLRGRQPRQSPVGRRPEPLQRGLRRAGPGNRGRSGEGGPATGLLRDRPHQGRRLQSLEPRRFPGADPLSTSHSMIEVITPSRPIRPGRLAHRDIPAI